MKTLIKVGLVFFGIVYLTVSCSKDDEPLKSDKLTSEDSIYFYINELMPYWYLWNDSIPELDYLNYDTPQDLMADMMVSIDHWSFVDKAESVSSYFNEGEDFGYGFYLAWDSEGNLRVILSYPGTDAYAAGIDRGCIISTIDGVNAQKIDDFDFFFNYENGSSEFSFIDNNGNSHSVTLTKETFNMKGVLCAKTYKINNATVGYMVFQSFLGYSEQELKNTIDSFNTAGVTDLIIDLRFNSGGYLSIAGEMADMLIPSSKVGANYYTLKHNSNRSAKNDTTVKFHNNDLNLNLNRVFFLTNEYSASASELVINCLKPHMTVKTIGNTTYGKPVAMYGFEFQDWFVYPVAAKIINSDGFGDYFSGIAPDQTTNNENNYAWGDLNEPALHQAIYYITNGSFDPAIVAMKGTKKTLLAGKPAKLGKNLLLINK